MGTHNSGKPLGVSGLCLLPTTSKSKLLKNVWNQSLSRMKEPVLRWVRKASMYLLNLALLSCGCGLGKRHLPEAKRTFKDFVALYYQQQQIHKKQFYHTTSEPTQQ
eukprot:scaffold918_cov126-Cylindrotheca_fusiformis.AAC.68